MGDEFYSAEKALDFAYLSKMIYYEIEIEGEVYYDRFEAKEIMSDEASGFKASLLYDTVNGEYIVVFAGTKN